MVGEQRHFYVYLLASRRNGTLYLGMTNDIVRRVSEHRMKLRPGFTRDYDVHMLVWYDLFPTALDAITAEKAMKKWRRDWKLALIEKDNPDWRDLWPEISGEVG
jgi:putative endonuclease